MVADMYLSHILGGVAFYPSEDPIGNQLLGRNKSILHGILRYIRGENNCGRRANSHASLKSVRLHMYQA